MIVLALTQNSVHFVLFNLIECDQCIAALILIGLCEYSVFIISTECVHENVRLGRCHVHTTTTALHLAPLDLRVVAFGYLETRPEHTFDNYPLNNLFCSLALQVYSHDLAVGNPAILDLDGVIGVGQAVDCARFEIIEGCI